MHWRQDLTSKMTDGLLAPLAMYLALVLVVLLVGPIQKSAGRPGLLVFTLFLVAMSVTCLERSLAPRLPEWNRAWYGLFGGLLAWASISLSNDLGVRGITSVTGILVLILFTLTVTRLWRRYLPVGGRFYSLTFILAWIGQLILDSQPVWTAWYGKLAVVFHLLGYAAIVSGLVAIWLIFTQTNKRLDRLYLAPVITLCLALSLGLLLF